MTGDLSQQWLDRIGIVAEEKVFGPGVARSVAQVRGSPTLDESRGNLTEELRERVEGGERVESAFVEIRDREVPNWGSPLIAVTQEDHFRSLGRALFAEVRDALRRHFFLEEAWQYVVVALFVLQARTARVLPAVFYLFLGGPIGTGKTNLEVLIAALTDGLLLENVSVPALARSLGRGQTLVLDEIDVDRGREVNKVRDALLGQGYRATAAPYVRWDVAKKAREEIPIFGPKVAALRSSPDDALASRGFLIPSVRPAPGLESYQFVLRNLWPDLGYLPDRLCKWGEDIPRFFDGDRLRRVAFSPEFAQKVGSAARKLGANRESEPLTVALLTAEIAGMDVTEELSSASNLRETELTEAEGEALEELRDVVLDLTGTRTVKLDASSNEVSVKQSDVRRDINRRRKERGERPLSDRRFATLRRELGVKDLWLGTRSRAPWWSLPELFLGRLNDGQARLDSHGTLDSLSSSMTENGSQGSQVGGSVISGGAETFGPDPGDLYEGRPSRADRLRLAKAGANHALHGDSDEGNRKSQP